MARRKPHEYGTGKAYEYPKGSGKYIVKVPDGHGRFITRRAVGRAAAEALHAKLLARRDAGLTKDDDAKERKTLQELVDTYKEKVIRTRQESQRPLSDKTIADYADTIRRYLLPDWASYRMEEFDALLVLDIYGTLARRRSPAVAHRALTKLHMLCGAAVRWGWLKTNPVDEARPDIPPLVREEKKPLTSAQWARLLTTVEEMRFCVLYHVALTLGLRLGELLGLQWIDIDWEARTLSVRRQVQEVKGKLVIKQSAKSDAGNRTLPLPPRLYARLRHLWERRGDSVFLFPNEDGRAQHQSSFQKHWRGGRTGKKTADGSRDVRITGVREKAELPETITMHSLRHTVGTGLLDLGVQGEIRDAIMGHGKKKKQGDDGAAARRIYAHVTPHAMRVALEAWERVLWNEGVVAAREIGG